MKDNSSANAQTSLQAPAFAALRDAAARWDGRVGPDRRVVDVVCLVPDVATFFEAVAAWDEQHFFPILIDDVEYTFKFLRAFRPARVIRFPRKAEAAPPDQLWLRALESTGRAWVPEGIPTREQPRGDVVPKSLGPVPPSAVATHPGSESLAGAVALAAGHFQPLLRWETEKKFADVLTSEEALKLATGLEAELATQVGKYGQLGDELDFVTLAGDYPLRFSDAKGRYAFDDMLLRSYPSRERWGFVGRLIGNPTLSVYRAMCSLFLPTRSALMFNGYGETEPPWNEYATTGAASLLGRRFKVATRSGDRARIDGWHQAFDPVNPHDLVFVNSSGGPRDFAIAAGSHGVTQDVPVTVPTAVHFVHSYSAESVEDPSTIAGRWLANGAFVYYGSTTEPYLQSFRTPLLVSTCLNQNLPMVAAVRKLHFELFGQPWRLAYFGDPLFRTRPVNGTLPRSTDCPALKDWPPYVEYQTPAPSAPEAVRMNWALKAAIARLRSVPTATRLADIAGVLMGIDRGRLEPALRPVFDDLLIDTLQESKRPAELLERLLQIKAEDRSPAVQRHLETLRFAAMGRAEISKDFRQAVALWSSLAAEPFREGFRSMTLRVGDIASTATQMNDWRSRLKSARRGPRDEPSGKVIDEEIKRVEEKLR